MLLLLLGCRFDPWFALTDVDDADIDQQVYEAMIAQRIVGLGLGIVLDGKVVYLHGYGFESLQDDIPVDPNVTLFRWASMSKTLTGTLAAMGVVSGEVDLDEDIRHVYPRYPHAGVHLRHLLAHTSGAMHYDNGSVRPAPPAYKCNNPKINTGIRWALETWIDEPLLFEPGEKYSYSSFGFNLAGVVLEEMMGDDFNRLIQNNLASPFGMSDLQPDKDWDRPSHRANGYVLYQEDGTYVHSDRDFDVSWKLSGGGFMSTTADAANFCVGLLDASFSPEVRSLMWSPQVLNSGVETNYGLGWELSSVSGQQRVSHGGYQEKVESLLHIFPEEGSCFVAFSNTREGYRSANVVKLDEILSSVENLVWARRLAGK